MFVFGLLRFDSFVLKQASIHPCQVFHEEVLFVCCLEQTLLVRSELFQLCLKELGLMVCDRFLAKNQGG